VTFLTLVAAVANTLAAFGVSDLCIDDPDSRAIDLLLHWLGLKSTALKNFLGWPLKTTLKGNVADGKCWDQPPTQFLLNGVERVQKGVTLFDEWSNSDKVLVEVFKRADCGILDEIKEFTTPMNKLLNMTSDVLDVVEGMFDCGFWMRLLEKGLHQATCYDGMEALSSVSLLQFIAVVLCMLVVTFRVALWDVFVE